MASILNQGITVLWVAESNFVRQNGIKPHTHEYYHLFGVRDGPIEFTIDKETVVLNKGQCLLAKPNVLHGLNNTLAPVARVYEVKFTVSAAKTEHLLSALPGTFPADSLAMGLVSELVAEGVRNKPSSQAFAADYLTALIDYLFRQFGDTAESEDDGIIDTVGYSELSQEIIRYLERNCDREVSLQEIADQLGFNKNYICAVFKRDSGMTIGSCQTAIRIRRAAELISFSDMSLSQVAAATGFVNPSHFNRIFKKVVKISPGQYRRMFSSNLLTYDASDSDSARQALQENGFIVSVLGRKKLTIEDIFRQMHDEGQETEDGE